MHRRERAQLLPCRRGRRVTPIAPQPLRELGDDPDVVARVARREGCTFGRLRTAFRVHINSVFFSIGRAGQDDIRPFRPLIAMMALVNHEGLPADLAAHRLAAQQQQILSSRGLSPGSIYPRVLHLAVLWTPAINAGMTAVGRRGQDDSGARSRIVLRDPTA